MKENKSYKKDPREKKEVPPGFTPKENDTEESPGDLPGDLEAKGVFGQGVGTSEKFRKKPLREDSPENLK